MTALTPDTNMREAEIDSYVKQITRPPSMTMVYPLWHMLDCWRCKKRLLEHVQRRWRMARGQE